MNIRAGPNVFAADALVQQQLGTRFLIFAQPPFIPGYERPELVWLAPTGGPVLAGPSDTRFHVISPVEPKRPYRFPEMPPYAGAVRPPAMPGPDGHFDHIAPTSPEFLSAHVYACARRVLDICEGYVGHVIPWFFQPAVDRLEIIPRIEGWDNAQSGFGFLELGEGSTGVKSCYGLNFDAVAHEIGHLVLLGELGLPVGDSGGPDFYSYHEAVADFISLLGLLHFDTALDRVLRRTKGNLLIHNELDRFAETSDEKQIRSFNNTLRVGDVGPEVHDQSRPFAATLFDCLVEVHQSLSFERGLSSINPKDFNDLRRQMPSSQIDAALNISKPSYELIHFASKAALQEARDIVGESVVKAWAILEPEDLTFEKAALAFLQSAQDGRGRRFVSQFEDCFRWRRILEF